jgi:hypothetical protein
MIENQVRTSELSYMDSIIHLCEQNNMEVEDVKKFLNAAIIERLEIEAMELNFIEKQNTLDI